MLGKGREKGSKRSRRWKEGRNERLSWRGTMMIGVVGRSSRWRRRRWADWEGGGEAKEEVEGLRWRDTRGWRLTDTLPHRRCSQPQGTRDTLAGGAPRSVVPQQGIL